MKKKENAVKILLLELGKGGYHIFFNLKVNGKSCRFLIDTGASSSVIDKGYFEKNFGKKNLTTIKEGTHGLHSSTAESHFGKIKELQIGKRKINNYKVAAIDLSHVNQLYANLKRPKISGILGSDLMVKYKMVIDYGDSKIVLP